MNAPEAYDPIAAQYDELFPTLKHRRAEYRWLQRHLPKTPYTLLDIGCGTGAFLRDLAPDLREGVGVDVSAAVLERARRHQEALSQGEPGFAGRLRFEQISGHVLPFPDAYFDIVTSVLSFRYLDWDGILPEIIRVLKPAGRFLMVDMAGHPLSRGAGERITGAIAATASRIESGLREVCNPRYRRALKTLVGRSEWKAMVAKHPVRDVNSYASALAAVFPGKGLKTLNQSRTARVVAFDSGPAGARALHGLAVLDWGVGGTGFFKAVKQAYPGQFFSYVSDSGFEPYGKVSHRGLVKRLNEIAAYLYARGTRVLVVACNAMSTVLGDPGLRLPPGFAICGVIMPTIQALLSDKDSSSDIAVIGGRRTVESGVYKKALAARFTTVTQSVGQGLSALIEAGKMETPEFRDVLIQVLKPLGRPSGLVLACTHYPAARGIIAGLLPGTKLYDPVDYTLARVKSSFSWPLTGPAHDVFVTTGDTRQTRSSAMAAFGLDMPEVLSIPDDLDKT